MVALARLASEESKDAEQEDGVVEERGDRSDAVSARAIACPRAIVAVSLTTENVSGACLHNLCNIEMVLHLFIKRLQLQSCTDVGPFEIRPLHPAISSL